MIIEAFLILFGLSYPGEWEERKVEGIIGAAGAKHHQYVYDNGNNVGFFKESGSGSGSVSGSSVGPGGIQPDKIDSRYHPPEKRELAPRMAPGVMFNLDNGHRDDKIVDAARNKVDAKFIEKDYHIGEHNCRHYKEEVDREYVKQGGKIKGDGKMGTDWSGVFVRK
jgi:hypothetical protein